MKQWLLWLVKDYLKRHPRRNAAEGIGSLAHTLIKNQEGVHAPEVYEEIAKRFGLKIKTVITYEKQYKRRLKSRGWTPIRVRHAGRSRYAAKQLIKEIYLRLLKLFKKYAEDPERVPSRPDLRFLQVFCQALTLFPDWYPLEAPFVRQWLLWLAEDYYNERPRKRNAARRIGAMAYALKGQEDISATEVYAALGERFPKEPETVKRYLNKYKKIVEK